MSYGATPSASEAAVTRKGVMYGLAAYLVWGFFPLYFKAVQHVPPLEVVSHRIAWSMLFLVILVTGTRRWSEIGAAFRTPKTVLTLSGTTLLIAANWLIFIVAIEKGEVLQSSLGYFMNPLVNVFLGFALLGERLRRWQTVSLVLAASGVLIMSLRVGQIPWIALLLAVTFGLYGLLRKTAAVDSLVGLSIETFLAAPAALAFLGWLGMTGKGAFLTGSLHDSLILPLAAGAQADAGAEQHRAGAGLRVPGGHLDPAGPVQGVQAQAQGLEGLVDLLEPGLALVGVLAQEGVPGLPAGLAAAGVDALQDPLALGLAGAGGRLLAGRGQQQPMGLVAPAPAPPQVPGRRRAHHLQGEVPAGQQLAEDRVVVGGRRGEVAGAHAQQPLGVARVALAPALDQVIPGGGAGDGTGDQEGWQDPGTSH